MGDLAAEYREMAARCVRLASDPDTTRDKTLLLEMAQRWLDLADKAERSALTDSKEW
jgi:hypothetical protein